LKAGFYKAKDAFYSVENVAKHAATAAAWGLLGGAVAGGIGASLWGGAAMHYGAPILAA